MSGGELQRISLHVGAGKTGSTALQAVLEAGRDELAAEGVSYPPASKSTRIDRDFPARGNAEILRCFARDLSPFEDIEDPAALAELLREQCRETAPNVILSNEELYKASPEKLRNAAEALDMIAEEVRVVCVFREVTSHAVSVYSQVVRNHGQTKSLPEFLERHEPQFVSAARNLDSAFGRDRMRYVIYQQDPDSHLRSVLRALDVSADVASIATERVNTSLSPTGIAVMRYVNGLSSVERGVRNRLVKELAARDRGAAHEPPPERSVPEAVLRRFEQETAALNAHVFSSGAPLSPPAKTYADVSAVIDPLPDHVRLMTDIAVYAFGELAKLRARFRGGAASQANGDAIKPRSAAARALRRLFAGRRS